MKKNFGVYLCMAEKITLPVPDMKRQRIKKVVDAYIELHDGHIHTLLNFSCERSDTNVDEPENTYVWKSEKCYDERWMKRSAVVSIDLQFTIYRQWAVRISVWGVGEDFSAYFDKDDWEKAKELADRLQTWMLSI